VYKEIFAAHSTSKKIYKFSADAQKVFQSFSDEIVERMKKQLKEDVIVTDNMSKDRKLFLR
jgi:hypothetical protein